MYVEHDLIFLNFKLLNLPIKLNVVEWPHPAHYVGCLPGALLNIMCCFHI